ncbi:hypothetical protein ABGT15_13175 [Flavobacterium enshiense]|uniref:hypothetical protein n=1 Tax=Flavobacterium enshiense TaxID=1341165 RepID=UPI00345DC123
MKNFIFLGLILFSSLSFACSCITANRENAVINTDVIISGKILSQENLSVKNKRDRDFTATVTKYTVLVIENLKGKLKKDIITIYGAASNCAYNFQVGESYIIFAIYKNRHLTDSKKVKKFIFTNKCTRTAKFDEQEIEKIKALCKEKGYS